MISLVNSSSATEALKQWRSREVFPTDLDSFDLRGLSSDLRMRSVFSARTTNAEYLEEVAKVVDGMLSGEINMAAGRLQLIRKLAQLGYDPEKGFPGDMANVPPAERGSIQDLSSEGRINLMLETLQRVAANYGQMIEGNTPYARYEYPAYELVRLYVRKVPRGSAESNSAGWDDRWNDAGESVGWVGALKSPKVALKDSPIWPALGNGAGGYRDTLGNPFPPYAFGSGKGRRALDRRDCVELGLISGEEVPEEMKGQLTPGEKEVNEVFSRLSPELREELKRELDDESEREFLRQQQEQFSQREQAAAADRASRIGETRAAHKAFLEGLMA